MKLNFRLIALACLIIFVSTGTPVWSQNDASMELPGGDQYRWLLDSQYRPYLSNAAENYLSLKFAPQSNFVGVQEVVQSQNLLVNDRSQDQNPSLTTQSETAIAVHGNRVALGWNDSGQARETLSMIGYGYSSDSGETFMDGGVVPPVRGGSNLGNPDIAVNRDGTFYYSTISLDANGVSFIGVAKSVDGGRTYSRPVDASTLVNAPTSFQDKGLIAVDNSGGQFDGNIYVSWTRFGIQGVQIMFAKSTDGGESFDDPIAVTSVGTHVSGSMPKVGSNGEVYVVWERYDTPGIHISKSLDGGETFGSDGVADILVSELEFIGQPASPNTCEGREILNGNVDGAFEFPSMDIDPVNGNVYVVFNTNPPGIDESDIHFSRSTDGGRTWSESVKINDDRTITDQFMPAIAVAPNGVIGVIWYDRRQDRENLEVDIYMATSLDGGRTWQSNRRMTTESSPIPPLGPNFDMVRPCYMADYIDITADQNSFYLAWGDNRQEGRTWETLEPMPSPREATANVALGNSVFVIGGRNLGFGEKGESRANDRYNTRSDRWSSHMPMPTPRSYSAAVSAGMSLFVGGGQSSRYGGVSNAFERFDALRNRWVELDPMPTARTDLGAARVGHNLYFMGGQTCVVEHTCGQTLNVVEIYDLRTGMWRTGKPIPEPLAGFSTVVIGERIYLVGGYARTGIFSTRIAGKRGIWEYHTGVDTWTARGALPAGRMWPIASNCDDRIIISGGIYDQDFSLLRRDGWSFNTSTYRWGKIASPKIDRFGIDAVTVGNKIYAIGGSEAASVPLPGANEVFNCGTEGSIRPDPDVMFTKTPVPQGNSMSIENELDKNQLRVRALSRTDQGDGIEFKINGLQSGGSVQLEVYNLSGVEIYDSGERNGPVIQWNLSTKRGQMAANGVYLYRIVARDINGKLIHSEVKMIMVLR